MRQTGPPLLTASDTSLEYGAERRRLFLGDKSDSPVHVSVVVIFPVTGVLPNGSRALLIWFSFFFFPLASPRDTILSLLRC
jgi:hypothetical protein